MGFLEVVLLGFISSLNAWMDGDDSGSWFVILCVAFVIFASIFSGCSD